MPISFSSYVAVVTGASAGSGKSYALSLAERGAKVLVNDFDRQGDEQSRSAVDAVVSEIVERGGKAVANYDSTTGPTSAAKIIEHAINAFGHIDILVNSASIQRDKPFAKMSLLDFDEVLKTNLAGATYCTRAAWPHMLAQQYGRVVMSTSMAGINGNFGQANFGSASLGIVGLMNTLAKEGGRKNVLVNSISSVDESQLNEPTISVESSRYFLPENTVAPAVVWLCSDQCTSNGMIIQAAAGRFSRVHYFQNEGVFFDSLKPITADMVAEVFGDISDMSNATIQPEPLMSLLAKLKAKNSSWR